LTRVSSCFSFSLSSCPASSMALRIRTLESKRSKYSSKEEYKGGSVRSDRVECDLLPGDLLGLGCGRDYARNRLDFPCTNRTGTLSTRRGCLGNGRSLLLGLGGGRGSARDSLDIPCTISERSRLRRLLRFAFLGSRVSLVSILWCIGRRFDGTCTFGIPPGGSCAAAGTKRELFRPVEAVLAAVEASCLDLVAAQAGPRAGPPFLLALAMLVVV
jgi:hypothetical protein